jgi:hypothetical protein
MMLLSWDKIPTWVIMSPVGGARVKVSLEVEALSGDGFTQQTMRTVTENCRTLRVQDSGFEE